jgi:hypothetical protein
MIHVMCHLSNGRQCGTCIGACHCTGLTYCDSLTKPQTQWDGFHKDCCNNFIYLGMKFLQLILYNLRSNPHPFYSFRELRNQMWIIISCVLDSWLRAGFWKSDKSRCTCCKNNSNSSNSFESE